MTYPLMGLITLGCEIGHVSVFETERAYRTRKRRGYSTPNQGDECIVELIVSISCLLPVPCSALRSGATEQQATEATETAVITTHENNNRGAFVTTRR